MFSLIIWSMTMWRTTCMLVVSVAVVKWWYTGLSGLLLHDENMAVMWWAAASTSPSAPILGRRKKNVISNGVQSSKSWNIDIYGTRHRLWVRIYLYIFLLNPLIHKHDMMQWHQVFASQLLWMSMKYVWRWSVQNEWCKHKHRTVCGHWQSLASRNSDYPMDREDAVTQDPQQILPSLVKSLERYRNSWARARKQCLNTSSHILCQFLKLGFGGHTLDVQMVLK